MHKAGVLHGTNASDKRGEGTNNRDKASKQNSFASVFFEELLSFVDVLLVDEGYPRVINDFLTEKVADPVVGGVT